MSRLIVVSIVVAAGLALVAAAGAHDPAAGAHEQRANAREGARQVLRYRGTSRSGQPIRFQVVTKAGKTRIKRLAVDVVTECWSDVDDDGLQDKIVAHISRLKGRLSAEGDVEVYYAPDEDTEYLVEGTLEKGKARLNVVVGGRFSADGIPDAGDLECDNWGTRYRAKRRQGAPAPPPPPPPPPA